MTKNNRISRRKFLSQGLQAGITLPVLGYALSSCEAEDRPAAQENTVKKLNILILGGTSFLGPHQIAYALARGHSITTFTRGKTEPNIHKDLFQQVTSLVGDRETDLTALETGSWDAVIDNSGHRTAWAIKSAELLKDRSELYLFTSSTGVYYPYLTKDADEDSEVLLVEPDGITDEDEKLEYWYGVMKATSENAVRAAYGDSRSIIVRPTYMIGPADKSNRFIHWPIRLSRGGEVMVPGKPDDPVQYADVRDVAEFMIRLIEEKKAGTYNA
ncbi:MAG: NAD-dependent epimerase/dehydratase family protein, partial [Lewinella sp.]|nr:NAD-dependent epimerase/dehydratase family protein [Lewinella sp.]